MVNFSADNLKNEKLSPLMSLCGTSVHVYQGPSLTDLQIRKQIRTLVSDLMFILSDKCVTLL